MVKKEKLLPVFLVLFFALGYTLYSFFAFKFFHYPARDLGEYSQVAWNLSLGRSPASTIKPTPNYFGLYFQPILIAFGFLFKIWANPLALLIVQALVVALSGFPIFWLAKDRLKDRLLAALLTSAYFLFFGIQNALAFGFYPISLATAFLAFCLYWAEKKNWRLFFVFMFLGLLCQENVALYFLFLAAYLGAVKKEKKAGLATGVLALTWYLGAVLVVMPRLSGFSYPHFVFESAERIFWPPVKIKTFFLVFGGVFFLPFLSLPEMVLCLPMLIEQFLISRPSHWTWVFHYDISITPPLFLAAMTALKKLSLRRALIFGLFLWGVFLNFGLNLPLARMIRPSFYKATERERALEGMLRLVPDKVSVAATDTLVPLLSLREKIFHFVSAREEIDRETDFILLGGAKDSWPLNTEEYQREVELLLKEKDYQLVYQKKDQYLFQRLGTVLD